MAKSEKRKYLAFLDIDGVFASARVHYSWDNEYDKWSKFDPIAIDFCNKMWDKYPIEFVLMSTWKEGFDPTHEMTTHWVMSAFKNSGFRGKFANPWKTNPTNSLELYTKDRAYEVKDYLDNYATDVVDYILFDDTRYRFKDILGKGRWVHTDHENGLLYKHMLHAQSLLGQWKER